MGITVVLNNLIISRFSYCSFFLLLVFQILYLMPETEADIHLNKEHCMKQHGRISFWLPLVGLPTLPCFYSDPTPGGNHVNINHAASAAGPSYASEWAPVLLLSV